MGTCCIHMACAFAEGTIRKERPSRKPRKMWCCLPHDHRNLLLNLYLSPQGLKKNFYFLYTNDIRPPWTISESYILPFIYNKPFTMDASFSNKQK